MNQTRTSIVQWVTSFLVFDAIFWIIIIIGCLIDLQMCAVGGLFAIAAFYPLFFLPITNDLLIPIIGVLLHALAGTGIGWLLRDRPISKVASTFAAGVLLMTSLIVMHIYLSAAGYIM